MARTEHGKNERRRDQKNRDRGETVLFQRAGLAVQSTREFSIKDEG